MKVIIPKQKLNNAIALLDSGDYEAAYALLQEIGDGNIITQSKYNRAVALIDSGDYEAAYILLEGLDYMDSAERLTAIKMTPEYWQVAQAGSEIIFGAYEQDNHTSNGKERIEWLVLAREDDRILVISKYALDCQPYNMTDNRDVTWETCTLRNWLNGTFLNAAFSTEEQKKIICSYVTADANPSYSTPAGNITTDRVFLLSISEANQYFSSDSARQCVPTAYAKAQGVWMDIGNCWWWLRSPGSYSDAAAIVYDGGYVSLSGNFVSYDNAVRPALWINLSSVGERTEGTSQEEPDTTDGIDDESDKMGHDDTESLYEKALALLESGDCETAYAILEELGEDEVIISHKIEQAIEMINAEEYESALCLLAGINNDESNEILFGVENKMLSDAEVGKYVFFGKYEQDNDENNGREPIEWLVLDKTDEKILLISRYALDWHNYNNNARRQNVTWGDSTLRTWLNGDFKKEAFSDEESSMIARVNVSADKNPGYLSFPGDDCPSDKIFLLSITEALTYFDADELRACEVTDYARSAGTSNSWWLRTPGRDNQYAVIVRSDGSINYGGVDVYSGYDYLTNVGSKIAVRPAMWVTLELQGD